MTDTANATAVSTPPGWEGLLDPGERIVWQGRPEPGFHFPVEKAFVAIFGMVFAGFALFWMVMASRAGGLFWSFGLIHFSVGVWIIISSIFGDTIRLRRTWYTLTDHRAFIATDMPFKGRQLQSYPITPDTRLDYRAGPPDTIIFSRERHSGSKGNSYMVEIGFERIDEGDRVVALMRAAQRKAAGS